jgi:hypothetical protein
MSVTSSPTPPVECLSTMDRSTDASETVVPESTYARVRAVVSE